MKKLFIITLVSVIMAIITGCSSESGIQNEYDVTVIKEINETVTSGTEGTISTHVNYYVVTDKGTFEIERDGIFYNPDFGTFEAGKKYHINTIGFRVNVLGIYPIITNHKLLE